MCYQVVYHDVQHNRPQSDVPTCTHMTNEQQQQYPTYSLSHSLHIVSLFAIQQAPSHFYLRGTSSTSNSNTAPPGMRPRPAPRSPYAKSVGCMCVLDVCACWMYVCVSSLYDEQCAVTTWAQVYAGVYSRSTHKSICPQPFNKHNHVQPPFIPEGIISFRLPPSFMGGMALSPVPNIP